MSKDFLGKVAPANYIAGLGRGATGFTTRSDIGPAREGPSELTEEAIEKLKRKRDKEDEEDGPEQQDPDNEVGLFNSMPYEADDEEADMIYEAVDAKMDERRKERREAREREELLKFRKERPKIQLQFADLKRRLTSVTDDEWATIPEVGDLVGRAKKKMNAFKERFFAVPDSVIHGSAEQSGFHTKLDETQQTLGGIATPAAGLLTNFVEIGQARDKVLGLKLDQVSDSVSGSTTIDPKGYLTDLNSIIVKSDAEIGDLKKARLLLNSVITTNPKHAPGWIAAARLEEVAGKLAQARSVIAKGCEACSKNEDVWLEAARLNTVENAKITLANAVRHLPQSVKIWLHAVKLETENDAKKRVLRRALDLIPTSVKVWKAAISLEENPADARVLMARAVELVPLAVEFWIALARLENHQNARKILTDARKTIPTSHEIYIAGAHLEEQHGQDNIVEAVLSRAVTALSVKRNILTRDQWLKQAEDSEKQGYIVTCQTIVRLTVALEVVEEDAKKTWVDDAESAISHGSFETARAVYAHALKIYPSKKGLWRRAAFLEKDHGSRESLDEILQRAVRFCPRAEMFWLMGAKEKWVAGDIAGAQAILTEAFKVNPESEQMWLAAVKLEWETGQHERARLLLRHAREKASDAQRVWMKSVVLERQLGCFDDALALLEQALEKYPTFDRLHMIRGQIRETRPGEAVVAAREAYSAGVKACPNSIPLWLLASRLEESAGLLVKARAGLERARLLNPKTPELWVEAIRVESRAGNTAMAKALIAKALQECPASGLIWTEAILIEQRHQRKARIMDAIKKCDQDPHVFITGSRVFWHDRKYEKARDWFQRAIKLDQDHGDAWAWWYRFETSFQGTGGDEEATKAAAGRCEEVLRRCRAAEPKHGETWQRVRKSMENAGKSLDEVLVITASQLAGREGPAV